MRPIEQIDGRSVNSLGQWEIELLKESSRGHPKIVAHQDEHLNSAAIALAQCFDEQRRLVLAAPMKPLLELIEDDDEFFVFMEIRTLPQLGEHLWQVKFGGKFGKPL